MVHLSPLELSLLTTPITPFGVTDGRTNNGLLSIQSIVVAAFLQSLRFFRRLGVPILRDRLVPSSKEAREGGRFNFNVVTIDSSSIALVQRKRRRQSLIYGSPPSRVPSPSPCIAFKLLSQASDRRNPARKEGDSHSKTQCLLVSILFLYEVRKFVMVMDIWECEHKIIYLLMGWCFLCWVCLRGGSHSASLCVCACGERVGGWFVGYAWMRKSGTELIAQTKGYRKNASGLVV